MEMYEIDQRRLDKSVTLLTTLKGHTLLFKTLLVAESSLISTSSRLT